MPNLKRHYEVSNLGNVRYLSRTSTGKTVWRYAKQKVVVKDGKQRVLVNISVPNSPVFPLDLVVAKTFLPNTTGGVTVRHLDGNPLNCAVTNLAWVSNSEIQRKAVRRNTGVSNRNKAVRQYTFFGVFVAEYASVSVASKATGISDTGIARSCRDVGTTHSSGGYLWRYVDNDELASRGR